MKTDPEYIPLAQAAAMLGVSWHAAWRLVLIGQLVGEQRNGRWWVDKASVRRQPATAGRS